MLALNEYHFAIAVLFLRIFLGILFLFQGYDKVFGIGIPKVAETFKFELGKKNIPAWLYPVTAAYSSIVELLGAVLLIIGFAKSYVMILLAGDLLLVSVAMGMMNPLWDLRQVFPRAILLFILMVIPTEADLISIDYLISKL